MASGYGILWFYPLIKVNLLLSIIAVIFSSEFPINDDLTSVQLNELSNSWETVKKYASKYPLTEQTELQIYLSDDKVVLLQEVDGEQEGSTAVNS